MSEHFRPFSDSARKATNVTLTTAVVGEARHLGINISRACEAGLISAIAEENARRWKSANATGMADWNGWVEEKGLPLTHHRQF